MTWHTEAACRDTDPDTFYPNPEAPIGRPTTGKPDPYATARTVCDGCPVQADCLTEAVTNGDPYGFRAGLTPDEIGDIILRRGGSYAVRACDICGTPYTAGPKAVTRKYCGELCIKAAQREASAQYKLRRKQARGVA